MSVDRIIDGYNLMHFAGLARVSYGPGGLQRARQRLLIRLTNQLSADEVQRTIVVFDAADVPAGESREEEFRQLRVIYSPPGMEADDVIERLISRHAAPRKLVVVSSDKRLMKAIRRRKGTSTTSEAFLDELEREPEPVVAPEPDDAIEETPLDAEAVREWMREFGVESGPDFEASPGNGSTDSEAEPNPLPANRSADESGRVIPEASSSLLEELEEELRRCLEEND